MGWGVLINGSECRSKDSFLSPMVIQKLDFFQVPIVRFLAICCPTTEVIPNILGYVYFFTVESYFKVTYL